VVDVPGIGAVDAAIVYGGIWYALVDADAVGLRLAADNVAAALSLGVDIKARLAAVLTDVPAEHGGGSAPSVLFYSRLSRTRGRHLLVLDSNKFDRSPCGTGTSARLALMALRGEIAEGETYCAENLLGAAFNARIAGRHLDAAGPAVIPEIEGQGYITAFSTIVKEKADPLQAGFLCR
jgi:proline racemase